MSEKVKQDTQSHAYMCEDKVRIKVLYKFYIPILMNEVHSKVYKSYIDICEMWYKKTWTPFTIW